ncbi:MAG: tetratricopeptide repeat protein [Candidatus Zixiibacteriota bacterium]
MKILVSAILVIALGLAAIYLLGDTPAALVIPVTTNSTVARSHFIMGRDLFERLRMPEAYEHFERAVGEDSGFALAYLYLSRTHPSLEGRAAARIRAAGLADRVSEGECLLIRAAEALYARRPVEEQNLLKRLVELYPTDPRAHNEFGNSLFYKKDWPGAVDEYLGAISYDPGFSQAYNGLGYCYRFLGNLPAAERCFLKYMELIPDDPNPYDSYADLLTQMNRVDEAITFYRRALEIRPDFDLSHLGIARGLNLLGRYAEARDQLRQFYELADDDGQRRTALLGLATSYADQGDLASAASELTKSCELSRAAGDFAALVSDLDNLGLVLLESGLPNEASKAFTRALQAAEKCISHPTLLESRQIDHLRRQALVWLGRSKTDAALACAKDYLSRVATLDDPVRLQLAHQTLGLIALAEGRPGDAADELMQSDLSQAYNQFHLARALEAIGDITQAIKYYRQASEYDQFTQLTQAFVRAKARDKVGSMALAGRPGPGASERSSEIAASSDSR